jgi:hypothetical protein
MRSNRARHRERELTVAAGHGLDRSARPADIGPQARSATTRAGHSTVLLATFNLVLNGLAVVVFALPSDVSPHWSRLQLPLLLMILAVLVPGLAMLLSALYVRFRDVKPIWEVGLQLAFYGSPILYAIETIEISSGLKQPIMLNPLAAILQQFRHAVLDPSAPTAADVAGGWAMLLVPSWAASPSSSGCSIARRRAWRRRCSRRARLSKKRRALSRAQARGSARSSADMAVSHARRLSIGVALTPVTSTNNS